MSYLPVPRLTPWVGRLIAANAVVLLLRETVVTSPAFWGALTFDPALVTSRPWTFVTYMFVHGGLLHLLFNSIGLFVFGGAVEQRMGARPFLLFYAFCGIGAAIFCWLLGLAIPITPFIGASGAVLGLAVAFAVFWPDARLMLFPLPIPITAKTLVIGLVAIDVLFALVSVRDGIAHLAHVGGAISGFLYFRVQGFPRTPVRERRPPERVVRAPRPAREAAASRRPAPAPTATRRAPEPDRTAAELDRLLDKISAEGMSSLTPTERRFLDEVARKKDSSQ